LPPSTRKFTTFIQLVLFIKILQRNYIIAKFHQAQSIQQF
jgi:hypothetical protein